MLIRHFKVNILLGAFLKALQNMANSEILNKTKIRKSMKG